MNQGQQKNLLDPYYKPDNVFERDQAYYTQMLAGTRRTHMSRQSRYSSRSPMQRQSQYQVNSVISPQNRTLNQSSVSFANGFVSNPNPTNLTNSAVNVRSRQYTEAIQMNNALKQRINQLTKGQTNFGTSTNVVKLSHYNLSNDQTQKLALQQAQIQRLQKIVMENQLKIAERKKITEQLSIRMTNIQQIDKQIYKNLQSSINKDKILLQKASSALARGQRREQVAKILHQIIT